ncbi:predicted protein [Nematostella vectensis]|uniref:G-protein coupled receptors family 1 profile domain-containing protein n=1 Tax=Nematostella vectensis TaxID=45351 RepID=A7S9V8_NEMVE|nr:predicted protein [Nematostella vectensis]|eukprot:XP_001631513.1 predicted protein [Nematostella vectensis]
MDRNLTITFLYSLAFNNVLTAASALVINGLQMYVDMFSSDWSCRALRFTTCTLSSIKIFSLLVISLEKYFSLLYPLKLSSSSLVKKVLALTWVGGVFVGASMTSVVQRIREDLGATTYTVTCQYGKEEAIFIFGITTVAYFVPIAVTRDQNKKSILKLQHDFYRSWIVRNVNAVFALKQQSVSCLLLAIYVQAMQFAAMQPEQARHRMSTNSERPAHRSRWYRFRDSLTEPMLENSIVPPPGDGQGAAGHDSYLYSHLSRNWTLISYTQKCKKEVKTGTEVVKPAVIVPKFVKPTQPTPTAKKTPKTPKLGTKRKRESQGPTPIRVKTKKVQAVGFERKVKKREFIFKRKRTSFTVEQDKMLLICKIVMGLMPKVTLRKFPVYELKTVVEKYCKGTGRKHAQEKRATRVAAMRLSLTNSYYRLFDNYSTKLSTFKECMMYQEKILPLETYDPDGNGPMPEVEIDQNDLDGGTTACVLSLLVTNKEFQGLDDFNLPFEETFLATVKKIYDRSRAEESNNLDTSKLVNSLSDLHDNYTLSKLELRKEKDVSLHRSPLTSVEDIRINVASDLIQAICNSKKRQVAAMHAFNCFSEVSLLTLSHEYEGKLICMLLYVAFMLLVKCQDLGKRGTGRKHAQEKRATRVAAMRLSLTNSYYRLFDNYSTKLSTFKECMMYQEKILPLETYDPDGNGPMPEVEIDQNDLDGGTTACVLSLLVTNKIKAKLTLPEEIVGISLDEQESIAESGLVEPDAQGPPRTSMPPKALTTVSTSIEQSDQLDSKSQNEASEKSGDARQVKRSVDKKASVRDEKNRHDEDKKQTEKEEGADTNKAPKDRIVGESNIGKRKASSVKPPTKKQKVAKDSGEESVTPPPEPTSRMNVYRVHGEQVSTLFASPYDLPSNNPIITKESTVHCHERDETAASTATLPAQRPSRISLMISRHALRDKVKKTKDYNQQEMTTLNCCPITLTPGTVGSKTDVADVELPRLLHEALGGSTEEAEHLKERTLKTELASKAGFSMKHGSKVPSVVDTLEKFLDSCIKEKKYTDGDVSLTRTIHEAAFNGQEFGISITRLKDVIEQKLEEFCDARYSLQEHLNNLYQSQLLWSVGTFEELVVCHAFVSPWCVDLPKTDLEEITVIPAADANQESENAEKLASDPQKESASKPESFKVISRPWLNLEGNVNKEFMRSVVKCIVCTVMERPGITQDQLVERFIAVVKPTVLEELFTMLESRGCISRHEIVETSSLTLFSCQVPKVVSYWLPEVDAFIKINSILREIENE